MDMPLIAMSVGHFIFSVCIATMRVKFYNTAMMHFEKMKSCSFLRALFYTRSVRMGAVVFFVCALLVSCGTAAKTDANGWHHDFDAAKKIAQKQHKNILLVFSNARAYATERNTVLQETVFKRKEFVDAVSDTLVLVNINFSDDESAAQREKKAQLVLMYNIVDMPAVFLLTGEGYYLAQLIYDSAYNSPELYARMVKERQTENETISSAVEVLKKSRGAEKVRALNALYERMPNGYGWCLLDVIRSVPTLDKKNETGLVPKYVLEAATADALFAFSKQDVAGAAQCFVDAAMSKKLDAEHVQQAYYLAGTMLASGGSTDYDAILRYFQLSCNAAPESMHAENIRQTITHLETLIAEERAAQAIRAADAK